MKWYKAIVSSTVLLIPNLAFAGGHFNEESLAGFHVKLGVTTEDAFVKLYGKGCPEKWASSGPYKAFYYFPKHHIFGRFYFSGAIIAGVKITRSNNDLIYGKLVENARSKLKNGVCTAKRELKKFQTGKGLRLGDSVNKLINLYGNPTSKNSYGGQETIDYMYFTSNENEDDPFMTVTIEHGHVTAIELHSGYD